MQYESLQKEVIKTSISSDSSTDEEPEPVSPKVDS